MARMGLDFEIDVVFKKKLSLVQILFSFVLNSYITIPKKQKIEPQNRQA